MALHGVAISANLIMRRAMGLPNLSNPTQIRFTAGAYLGGSSDLRQISCADVGYQSH